MKPAAPKRRVSVCERARSRLDRAGAEAVRLERVRVVRRLIVRAHAGLDHARRLISAGRCDEAQAAIDWTESKLATAKGLAAYVVTHKEGGRGTPG